MRVSSVLCCLILLGAGLSAEDEAANVLQRLLEAQRAVTTMSGRFVQTTVRADDPESGGTEFHGRVDLQAPAQYNLVYSNPKDDEWRLRHCSDGVTRWQIEQLFSDQPAEVSARPVVAQGGGGGGGGDGGGDGGGRGSSDLVGRIAALLRGDRAAVLADFTVQATALGEGFKLVLTPKPGPLTEQLVMVEAELDAAGHVQVLRFFDRQGNRITITVSEAVYNQPLPPETFTYPAP